MAEFETTDQMQQNLALLGNRYEVDGQSLPGHIEGLFFSQYLSYWDYIHSATLLSLQTPRTAFPDEMIFIVYHQITELYFKLILWEIEQLTSPTVLPDYAFLAKIERICRYYENLVYSFDMLISGMDKHQFQKFRTALTPASGFQSVQYRLIEIYATDAINLVDADQRFNISSSVENMYAQFYWKKGATNLVTSRKNVGLVEFEKKYDRMLCRKVVNYQHCNLWARYKEEFFCADLKSDIQAAMRRMDQLANVKWPLSHLRAATKFLQKGKETFSATGGTNWKQYLPPSYQQISFFPDLWTRGERDDWGKAHIMDLMAQSI